MSSDTPAPKSRFVQLAEWYGDNRENVQYAVLLLVFFILLFAGDAVADFLAEYWPLVLGPLVGWYMARWAVDNFYDPPGREVAVLDAENHTYRHVFIPELVFTGMTQAGNNVVYHTPAGKPLYIARSLDLENKTIEYGWIHELDPQTVLSRETAFSKWDMTLNKVLVENLELMDHPHIIGLGYARKSVRDHLDGLGHVMGFDGLDFSQHAGQKVNGRTGEIVGEDKIVTEEDSDVQGQ